MTLRELKELLEEGYLKDLGKDIRKKPVHWLAAAATSAMMHPDLANIGSINGDALKGTTGKVVERIMNPLKSKKYPKIYR